MMGEPVKGMNVFGRMVGYCKRCGGTKKIPDFKTKTLVPCKTCGTEPKG
jgi:formamidopyrimidine-DNA glycosylase